MRRAPATSELDIQYVYLGFLSYENWDNIVNEKNWPSNSHPGAITSHFGLVIPYDISSPWANWGPHAHPMILREWYHFVQGTLRNHITNVIKK